MIEVDGKRVVNDLRELAKIGAYKTGVHRPPLSPEDVRARAWLVDRMRDAGLAASIDGIGNVVGRSPRRRAILVGSHIETQPQAGWLDGTLGVIYGVEIARSLREGGHGTGVDVGAWFDEEWWYGHFLGSRSFCGMVDEAEIDGARHRESGSALRDDLHAAGYAQAPRAILEPARHLAYMEAHIEQGAWLDSNGLQIGIVVGIVGGRNYIIRAHGEQNHAGATRMDLHRDAGLALCRLRMAIAEAFPKLAGPRTVWTSGFMRYKPGVSTVIPGEAEMQFQFRDLEAGVLERLDGRLRELAETAAGPCRIEIETIRAWPPALMNDGLQNVIEAAAARHAPGRHVRMQSSAGHDAQNFAAHVPTAMMFVPSIGGISHHWTEDTKEEDIVAGCQVFAAAVGDAIEQADAGGLQAARD